MSTIIYLALATLAAPPEAWDAAGEAPIRKAPRRAAEHVPGSIWLDAEDFSDYGGWKMDTQFVHLMGSAYLIAPGVTGPVEDATATVEASQDGNYQVWVRHRDWLPEHHPGRFGVLVNGRRLDATLGEAGHDTWHWTRAGETRLDAGANTVALHDLTGYFSRCDALILTTDADYTPPEDMDAIEQERARLTGISLNTRHVGDFDVVVVGGGPSGTPAAIAAARTGAKTALIQDRPVLGGNASLELNVSLQGAVVSHQNARETGIIEETSRIMAYEGLESPTIPLHRLVEAEPNLSLFVNTRVVGVEMASPERIAAVTAVDTLTGERLAFGAKNAIDCTGDGWVGYYAGADYRIGREAESEHGEEGAPETPDNITLSGAIMGRNAIGFLAEDAGEPVTYQPPPWAAELPDLVEMRRKPPRLNTGAWWLEYPGDVDDLYEAESARDELIRISLGYWDYMKNKWADREHVANMQLTYVPWLLAKRETRRLLGDHILTVNEVLEGTEFPDRISYGGWPVDVHHPEGIYGGDSPFEAQMFTPNLYTIPFRCLYSRNIENLLFAGRCASFTHYGLGSVRVQRTLATLGQAAGTAAAMCVDLGESPRTLAEEHIGDLQQTLLKNDQYIPGVRNEDADDLARTAKVTASSVADGLAFEFGQVQLLPTFHPMEMRRAFLMPAASGEVGRVSLRLKSEREDDAVIRLHVRQAKNSNDFSSTEDLAVAEAVLPANAEEWLSFEVNCSLTEPFVWIWLEPVDDVYWQLMRNGLPLMRRAYASGNPDANEVWATLGGLYACALDPPAMLCLDCSAENVVSGVARMEGGESNMWRSDPKEELPQHVTLDFGTAQTFDTVQLTFVTDLNVRNYGNVEPGREGGKQPEAAAALSGVTAYTLQVPEGDEWNDVLAETGNFQRWRRHQFPPVTASKLRIRIDRIAGGSSAGIYEVRVYNHGQ